VTSVPDKQLLALIDTGEDLRQEKMGTAEDETVG